MRTRILVNSGNKELFGFYDTNDGSVRNQDGVPLEYDGVYLIGKKGLELVSDDNVISEHFQTFRIIND